MTREEEKKVIAIARKQCTDDLEIDSEPTVSQAGDEGYWVAAWIFVRKEEMKNA